MNILRELALLLVLPSAAPRLEAQEASLESRAREVQATVSAEPVWPADLFDEAFLKAVPLEQMKALSKQLVGEYGAIRKLVEKKRENTWSARYDAELEKGFTMSVSLTLDAKPPHSVVGLWFGPPTPLVADLAGIVERLKKLRGKVSFGVWKLGDELEPLAELESDTPLALGSAFKLYVLGCLARELEQGNLRADTVVALQPRWRSLPSGRLQAWPVGTPQTLAALACAMISESDNTATDHLLFALGREKVESMLAPMGNGHAEKSLPFLSTAEMFRLKLAQGGKLADEYARLDVAARRAFLARELDPEKLTLESLGQEAGSWSRPRHVDDIEWFASAREMARALDWLRKATEGEQTKLLRGVLAINPGLQVDKEQFPWIGFKGGSEPGVLNLTCLLQHRSGAWYALSAGWNDPKKTLDDEKLTGLVTRAIELVALSAK